MAVRWVVAGLVLEVAAAVRVVQWAVAATLVEGVPAKG